MLLGSVFRLMLVCLTTFWIASFVLGRLFVFCEAYTSALRVVRDEAWIREQCADPQFYANLRQHSDLCQSVQINFERSPLLIALNAVSETAHLCGRYSCAENLAALARGGWPVMLTVGLVTLAAPTTLYYAARSLLCAPVSSPGNGGRGVGLLPYNSDPAADYHHHYNICCNDLSTTTTKRTPPGGAAGGRVVVDASKFL